MNTTAMIYALSTGFGLGWIAIPHCYAMCGPLHISICALNWKNSIKAISLFNIGRIFGYTVSGALFGYFGWFISGISKTTCPHCKDGSGSGYLAFLFPAILMFFISLKYFLKKGNSTGIGKFINRFITPKNKKKLVLFGLTATLLPCGILYVAFASAVTTASPIYGAILMFSFVITHTFFLQLGAILGSYANNRYEKFFNIIFPWLALLLGFIYLFLFIKNICK